MTTPDFTTTLLVDQTPAEVFNAINNVRGWWSEEIEGSTHKFNDEFTYRYEDVHYCKMKLIEVVPETKVVWLVMENYFKFTDDKNEWTGNKIIFDIAENDNATQLQFTQVGLIPAYECYNICRDAWTNYIHNSLRSLIVTGKGQPNPKGGRNDFQEEVSEKLKRRDFHTSITVSATPHEAFESINNVTEWWTENLEGSSHKLNDEFSVRFGDVHYSKQRVVEMIPDKRVVWFVNDSKLNFIEDKQEWTNTKIVFEINNQNDQTQIHFTQIGLVPEIECYNACSNAWTDYLQSLKDLINTGKGKPASKEKKEIIAEIS